MVLTASRWPGENRRNPCFRVPAGGLDLRLGEEDAGAEVRGAYVSGAKICSQQVSVAQVGTAQIGPDQVGAAQAGSTKIRAPEPGFDEVGTPAFRGRVLY